MHERRHFYKYMTAGLAKIVLANRTLRWSSPTVFNDPFDVDSELKFRFTQEELNQALQLEVAERIEQGDSSVGHAGMAALIGLLDQAGDETRRSIAQAQRDTPNPVTDGQVATMSLLREIWLDIVSKMRVLCLSELPDVTSMWHHYSDQYRGVVLEFEAVDEIDSGLLCARPVTYSDDPPRLVTLDAWLDYLMSGDEPRFVNLFTEYQYRKTNDWASEKEWRVVSSVRPGEDGPHSDYPFDDRELTGVFLGPAMETEARQDILGLLRFGLEHVRVYESVRDDRESRFHFSELQDSSRAG